MNYPQINLKSFPKGSPEIALAKYLLAWQEEDWDKMAKFAQLTWKSHKKSAVDTLKSMHEPIKIKGAEIQGKKDVTELNPNMCQDLIATIYYTVPAGDKKFRDTVKEKKSVARLICETSPFRPGKDGKWGVNPISALRKV